MVSSAKRKRGIVDTLGSGAVETLRLAVPLAKAIPLIGGTVEGSLQAVLYIITVKDEVKMKKEQCQLLAERVVTITSAITTELMKADRATLERRENSVAALRGTLRDIERLLKELGSASLVYRILQRGEVGDKLTLFRQKLDTAIDAFHIAENMRTEDVLSQLLEVIKQEEKKRDISFMHGLLQPVAVASYTARSPDSGCFPGTRRALLEQISTWFYEDNNRVPQTFWLSGLGGTGKTAVAHTVCEKVPPTGQLGASFFFSRDVADRRRVSSIIPTLAFQLASINPTYRRELCDVLQSHPDAPSRAQQYQLKELLLDPLKKVTDLPRYLVVLDALDECDKERGTEGGDLIPLIIREIPNSGLNIKILITSRPERSIQDMFKIGGQGVKLHDASVLHDLDQSSAREDIESYLAYHLQRIQVNRNITPPWPEDGAFNDLVTRAGLFFIFAATIINFVADNYYNPQTQLQRLLASGNSQSRSIYTQVDLLYLQILKTAIESRADAPELSTRFRKIVGAVILLQDPLSIPALAQLLEHDEIDLEGALSPLHALLDVPADHNKPIRIFHPSFRDFLLVEERCHDTRFSVPEHRTHAQLALYCLKIMIKHLKRDICDIGDGAVLNSEIPDLQGKLRKCVPPALLYACQHWGNHVSQSAHDTDIQKELVGRLSEFVSTRILYWIEVLSLEGRFPLCITNLIDVLQWCKAGTVDTMVSHLIHDAYRLTLDFHNVINVSAIQVYHSALVFIPECSLLRAYKHELPTVHMTSPRAQEWDAALLVFEGHRSCVNMVSFSLEGSRAASVSDDGHVHIWNTSNGAQVACLKGHDGAVRSVDYSPDSACIVSGGADATIRIWDAVTGSNISILRGHEGGINTAIFSSDGRNIASGSEDNTVRIWDALEKKQSILLNGHLAPVTCLGFIDGLQILSGSLDSTIRLWNLNSKDTVKVLPFTDAVLSLAVSAFSRNSIFMTGCQDGIITILDVATLKEIRQLQIGEVSAVNSLACSSQGNRVVSGFSNGTICVWDVASGTCIAEYRGHSGPVECTRFMPYGMRILSSSADRTVRLWDASINGVQGSKDYVVTVEIPNHAEYIISGSTHGKVALWKTDDGSLVYEVDVHHGIIHYLTLTHDDKLVASASEDQMISILNVDNGSVVAMLKGHTDEVYTVLFSSDDTLLVSASQDGKVILWDTLAKKPKRCLIHSAGVGVASFSPDDRLLCSGTLDGTIYIWNAEIGDIVATLKDYPSPILWVSFSPNGQWLTSWFEDEAVRVWRVEGTKFQTWPHKDWRLDRGTDGKSGEGKRLVEYGDLLPDDEPHYLQEDGWITLPQTGKRICWVPPSRRQPWLRTFWESRKGLFATGSQAGTLTIVDLRSTVR